MWGKNRIKVRNAGIELAIRGIILWMGIKDDVVHCSTVFWTMRTDGGKDRNLYKEI